MFATIENLLQRKPVILQLLRFACIGALNTALDFIILNLLTDAWGIHGGVKLWMVNAIGVTAAIIQSYYWNKHWAFAANANVSVIRQFFGLVVVGGLGFVAFLAAVLPSLSELFTNAGWQSLAVSSSLTYYGIVLLAFVLLQIIIGVNMGFHDKTAIDSPTTQFGKFVLISVIGVLINSTVLALLTAVITQASPDIASSLAKNIAKLAAVFVSLAWNFIGYKFFVFRK